MENIGSQLRLVNTYSELKLANHRCFSIHPNIFPTPLTEEAVYTVSISLKGRWQGRKAAALWGPSDVLSILSAENAISSLW